MAHPPPGYATVKSEWSECCEDPDAEQGRWQYVGKGRGAFAKVDDIQFVGAGLGEYDVAGPKKSRWLYWFACLGCFLLLLALGLVAIFSHQSRAPGHSEMRYDCYLSGGILPQPGAQLLETWSTPHRIWCCDNLGVACAESTTSSPMPTTWIMVPVPKFEDAMMAPGLVPPIAGAPATAPFVATFHCHVGMPGGWPPAQKEFCCQHVNIGCEAPPAPPVPPEPDCAISSGNNPQFWIATKRAWCCSNKQIGCEELSPFQCEGDMAAWAEDQKGFCCATKGLGCTTALPEASELYDCTTGVTDWEAWPTAQQDWCCQHHGRACAVAQAAQYTCDDAETSWGAEQRQWCCTHHGRACE